MRMATRLRCPSLALARRSIGPLIPPYPHASETAGAERRKTRFCAYGSAQLFVSLFICFFIRYDYASI